MLQQLQVGFQCEHHWQSEVQSAVDASDDSHVLVAGMSRDLERSLHHRHYHHQQQLPLLRCSVSHSTAGCTQMTSNRTRLLITLLHMSTATKKQSNNTK